MLTQLFVSENRISHVKHIRCLQSLLNLADFFLSANVIDKLPHYRLRILDMFPGIRTLDGIRVDAKEQVKSQFIFGEEDTEMRRQIFEGHLPKEKFEDRRTVTAELVRAMEFEMFGQEGGPAGSDSEDDFYKTGTSFANNLSREDSLANTARMGDSNAFEQRNNYEQGARSKGLRSELD